jgi:hypothetical protein
VPFFFRRVITDAWYRIRGSRAKTVDQRSDGED